MGYTENNSIWPQDPRKKLEEPPPKNFGESIQRAVKNIVSFILLWTIFYGAIYVIGRVTGSEDETDSHRSSDMGSDTNYSDSYYSDTDYSHTNYLATATPDMKEFMDKLNEEFLENYQPGQYRGLYYSDTDFSDTDYLDDGRGCPDGCTYHKDGCDIKGNISYNSGEKIYHVPGQEYYYETEISPEYGERWFCSEQEAIDSGWRKSWK